MDYPGELIAEKMLESSILAQLTAPATRRIHQIEQNKPRCCAALGWVACHFLGKWTKTGHVRVIDLDNREYRQRQPWFILAAEWPTNGKEAPDGSITIHAEAEVESDDSTVKGVLPGDRIRTSIGMVQPICPSGGLVLKRFGEDFEFEALCSESRRKGKACTMGTWPRKGNRLVLGS